MKRNPRHLRTERDQSAIPHFEFTMNIVCLFVRWAGNDRYVFAVQLPRPASPVPVRGLLCHAATSAPGSPARFFAAQFQPQLFCFALARGNPNRNFAFVRLGLLGKPEQRFFKIFVRAHLPALNPADEGKGPGSAVRIAPVEHRQPLMFAKAGFVKGVNQRGQLRRGEERFSRNRQRPQVQQGPIELAFPARVGDKLESFFGSRRSREVREGQGG